MSSGGTQITEFEVAVGSRSVRAYVTSPEETRLNIFWHHGSPNVGTPPRPLFDLSERLGIRWVSHDRPGYGGSSPQPGRSVASVASDVAAIADGLEIDRFAVMGHSGGGPHALACAALLPDRVLAAVSCSGLAPIDADGLDWFAGFGQSGVEELQAATLGRASLLEHIESAEFDPEMFTEADHQALAGDWSWLNEVASKGFDSGPDGFVDDDLANVSPWGFEPGDIAAPVLLIHGDADRMVPADHSRWLHRHIEGSDLWIEEGQGHISALRRAPDALEWLLDSRRRQRSV